jgi:hypothetical protein
MRPLLCLLLVLCSLLVAPIPSAAAPDRTEERIGQLLDTYRTLAGEFTYTPADSTAPRAIDRATQLSSNLQVCTMPPTPTDGSGVRHPYCWLNRTLTIWGRASDGQLPYDWTWDFGDGTAPVHGTATTNAAANYISVTHQYTTQGQKFARLTVTDGSNTVTSTEVFIQVAADDEQVRVDAAIEDGMRWLYLHQLADGRWSGGNTDYDIGSTGAALAAFQLRGHLMSNNPCTDIYAATVKAGIDYLLSETHAFSLPSGQYPDINGDGIGIYFTGASSYAHGLAMMGLASSSAMDYVVPSGAAAGQSLRQVLTNTVEQCYAAQSKSFDGTARGGWRYSIARTSGDADNSAVQWVVLGMDAAEEAGIPIEQHVRDELQYWVAYSQSSDGGFGYTDVGNWNNIAKTASGMISLKFLGRPAEDADVQRALGYIDQHWNLSSDGSWPEHLNGNLYAMYSLAKSCRSLRYTATGFPITTIGTREWYPVYVSQLLHSGWAQYSDGSWPWNSSPSLGYPLATAFGILTLNREAVVGCYPVASASASPASASCAHAVRFDGSTSTHSCPSQHRIVEWLWDFDDSDGLDWVHPDGIGAIAVKEAGYVLPAGENQHVYHAVLRVKDEEGTTSLATVPITMTSASTNNPPVACLRPACETTPYSGPVGQPITFDATASYDPDWCNGDRVDRYEWDFEGDGTFTPGPAIASNTWDDEYAGQVGLRVYDTHGLVSLGQVYVDVFASRKNLSIASEDISIPASCPTCAPGHLLIDATIHLSVQDNVGINLPQIQVDFYDGNPAANGEFIGSQYIPAQSTSPASFDLTQDWAIGDVSQSHTIYVRVDPYRRFAEWNEDDNEASTEYRTTTFAISWSVDPADDPSTIEPGVLVTGSMRALKWSLEGTLPADVKSVRLVGRATPSGSEIPCKGLSGAISGPGAYTTQWLVPFESWSQGSLKIVVTTEDGSSAQSPWSNEFKTDLLDKWKSDPKVMLGCLYQIESGQPARAAHGDLYFWCDGGHDEYAGTVNADGTFKIVDAGGGAHHDCRVCSGGLFNYGPVIQLYLRSGDEVVAWWTSNQDERNPQYVGIDMNKHVDWISAFGGHNQIHPSVVLERPVRARREEDDAIAAGRGPLVLVNGWTESSGSWSTLRPALEEALTDRGVWELYYPSFKFSASFGADLVGYGINYLANWLNTGPRVGLVAHSFGAVATRGFLSNQSVSAPYTGQVDKVVFLNGVNHGSRFANLILRGVSLNALSEFLKCSSASDQMVKDMGIGSAFQHRLQAVGLPDLNGQHAPGLAIPGQYLSIASYRYTCSLGQWVGVWESNSADGPVSVASASLLDWEVPVLVSNGYDHSENESKSGADVAGAIRLFLQWNGAHATEGSMAEGMVGSLNGGAPAPLSAYVSPNWRVWTEGLDTEAWEGGVSFAHQGRYAGQAPKDAEPHFRLVSTGKVADVPYQGYDWRRAKVEEYTPDLGQTGNSRFYTAGWMYFDSDDWGEPWSHGKPKHQSGGNCGGAFDSDDEMGIPAGDYWVQVDGAKTSVVHVASGQFNWAGDLAMNQVAVVAMSPVDLEVVTATGVIDRFHSTLENATYARVPLLTGEYHTVVRVPFAEETQVHIGVSPSETATPGATFTLLALENGVVHELARNVLVSEIPAAGYDLFAAPPPQPPSLVEVDPIIGGLDIRWSLPAAVRPVHYAVFYGSEHSAEPMSGVDALEGVSGFLVSGDSTHVRLNCLPDSLFAVAIGAVDAEGRQSLWTLGPPTTPLRHRVRAKLTPSTLNLGSNGRYFDCVLSLGALQPCKIDLPSLRLGGQVLPLEEFTHLGYDHAAAESTLTTKFAREAVEALFQNGGIQPVTVTGWYLACKDTLTFEGADTIRVIKPHVIHPASGERLGTEVDYEIEWEVPREIPADYINVVLSTNGGTTWTNLATNLTRETRLTWHTPAIGAPSAMIGVEAYANGLFAGRGVSPTFQLGDPTAVGDVVALPKTVYLAQPRPTPFMRATTIEYGLPRTTHVRLQVFDVSGRLVRTLVDGLEAPGRKTATWEGGTESGGMAVNGVYVVRLEADGKVKVQRAVFLR